MSNSWDYGYVSDVEYVPGFYVEQTPSHLNTVCLVNGLETSVSAGEPFAYCELGCGRGDTALGIAATSPLGEIWAFDFNPAHIAGARQIAKEAGLTNIHLEECSFQDLAEGKGPKDMPQFDFVTLHGVWSWISHENRGYIVRFLAKFLKPGGIVYVSYNALPGRSSNGPTRQLLFMLAQMESGQTDKRALSAIKKIKELVDIGVQYLPPDFVAALSKEDNHLSSGSYLSHEYLNEKWTLDYQLDVATDLASAKLSYAGSAAVLENYSSLFLSEQQRAMLSNVPLQYVETMKDYFINRPFRRDIYIRGYRRLVDHQALRRIEKSVLQLAVAPDKVRYEIGTIRGGANLNKVSYEPIFNALAKGPMAIGDLLRLPELAENRPNAAELMGILTGSDQAKLVIPEKARASVDRIRKFNLAYLRACNVQARTTGIVACSVTAQAEHVGLYEMLVYEAIVEGAAIDVDTLPKVLWKALQDRNDRIIHKGKTLNTEEETVAFLTPLVKDLVENRVSRWQKFGAL